MEIKIVIANIVEELDHLEERYKDLRRRTVEEGFSMEVLAECQKVYGGIIALTKLKEDLISDENYGN